MSQTIWREPIEFAAGDTLSFTRRLPDYPASEGWSLLYELRGGAEVITFESTPDVDSHVILVPSATTAAWLPGDYLLVGFAQNGAVRHQVYYASLAITPNTPDAGPEETFAQKMIAALEAVMLAKAQDDLAESAFRDSRFAYLTPEQLRTEHAYWVCVRRNEIAKERANHGRPTGNKIRPQINVKTTGPAVGMSTGYLTGYGGW